jgi:hypothetical protein
VAPHTVRHETPRLLPCLQLGVRASPTLCGTKRCAEVTETGAKVLVKRYLSYFSQGSSPFPMARGVRAYMAWTTSSLWTSHAKSSVQQHP